MLPNIQDIIQTTFYNRLMDKAVAEGYTVDTRNLSEDGSDDETYRDAQRAIMQAKGFCVEIFNNSNPTAKGFKKAPRIVIESEDFIEGETALSDHPIYEPNGEKFNTVTLPAMLSDFIIAIRLVADSDKSMRVITGILGASLPHLRGVPANIKDYPNEEPFWILLKRISFSKLEAAPDESIEHVYRYQIPDLLDTGLIETIENSEVAIEEITVELEINNAELKPIIIT